MTHAACNKLLLNLAQRCSVNDAKTLRKTKELVALLNSKQSLNYSETCKVIICLELAATLTSANFSREVAVKLSGCSKRNYINFFNNISKLLNLDKVYTVKEICLLVGVSEACDAAVNLFKKYQTIKTNDGTTMEHPMYGCAAVLAVCREEHHPFNLSKLVEISRIKKPCLKKLSEDFAKFYEKRSHNKTIREKETRNGTNVSPSSKQRNEYSRDGDEKEDEMTDEKFKDWKRRMLEDS